MPVHRRTLYSQQQFATLLDKPKQTINLATKYQIKRAMVGKRIDINHQDAVKFAQYGAPAPGLWDQLKLNDDWDITEVPGDITALLDKPLSYLIDKFGSATTYADWLKTIKEHEIIKEKQIKNAKATNQVVSREAVRSLVFGPISGTILKLLTDAPRTISARCRELVESGSGNEVVEETVRDILSDHVTGLKDKLTDVFRDEDG